MSAALSTSHLRGAPIDEAIHTFDAGEMDCFALLAMTCLRPTPLVVVARLGQAIQYAAARRFIMPRGLFSPAIDWITPAFAAPSSGD